MMSNEIFAFEHYDKEHAPTPIISSNGKSSSNVGDIVVEPASSLVIRTSNSS